MSLSKLATPNSNVVDLIEFKSSLNPIDLMLRKFIKCWCFIPVEKFVKSILQIHKKYLMMD